MRVLIVTFLIFILNFGISHALEYKNEVDETQIQQFLENIKKDSNLKAEEKCKKTWDFLWPISKDEKSDLRFFARKILLGLITPIVHSDIFYPPGTAHDLISRARHMLILGVHGKVYKSNAKTDFYTYIKPYYQDLGLEHYSAGKKYLECAENNKNENCETILLKQNIIPTYDIYAQEIEAFMDNGYYCETIIIKH